VDGEEYHEEIIDDEEYQEFLVQQLEECDFYVILGVPITRDFD
jgi:hypothetical protein